MAEYVYQFDSLRLSPLIGLGVKAPTLKLSVNRIICKTHQPPQKVSQLMLWPAQVLLLHLRGDGLINVQVFDKDSSGRQGLQELLGVLQGVIDVKGLQRGVYQKEVQLFNEQVSKAAAKLSFRLVIQPKSTFSLQKQFVQQSPPQVRTQKIKKPSRIEHFNSERPKEDQASKLEICEEKEEVGLSKLPRPRVNKIVINSLIGNFKALNGLGNAMMRIRLGGKTCQTEVVRNRKSQPVWIQTIVLERQDEKRLQFELVEQLNLRVAATSFLRLDQLSLNNRYVSKKLVFNSSTSEFVGHLFLDVTYSQNSEGLNSEDLRLPRLQERYRSNESKIKSSKERAKGREKRVQAYI